MGRDAGEASFGAGDGEIQGMDGRSPSGGGDSPSLACGMERLLGTVGRKLPNHLLENRGASADL